ncbi:phage tail length tape measure family protein [Mesorhizobium sp. RMAD-H1]|uniref:phage tail length tape measure family protein n=1 Tax=Mesorhizobium sp. RMAD-H1 TaxID=2587065 RepID=UPI00160CEFD4|nr:phage tail length tape measure family protein [Mesorhizobium sp. RMAD-H1]MBB2973944.1 GH24 family phage-related lysozyme (muramidase) [Mesorhizobium sp. RMAD-H1]
MAATAEDQARLLISIEATQRKFEKQLAAIAKAAGTSATGIENRFKSANDNAGKSFQKAGRDAEKSLGATRAAVSNLSFQLNDIAMGLASGTSPFTIMIQQGSQVAQALQGAGGGLVGAVKALGGAFATMVNPVSLASYALIGLTGAAVQYFMTLGDELPDADQLLKNHAELIKSFDAAFGIAEKGAKQYSDAVRNIALQKLRDEFGDLQKVVRSTADDVSDRLLGVPIGDFGGATKTIDDFRQALSRLDGDTPDLRGFVEDMIAIENQKGFSEFARNLAKDLRTAAQEALPAQDAIDEINKRLKTTYVNGENAKQTFVNLTAAILGVGPVSTDTVDKLVGKFKNELIPTVETAIKQILDYAENYSKLGDMLSQSPLGSVPPVFSGGGRFLNEAELQSYKASEAALRAAGESVAAALIKRFEGFRPDAYYDVNAYRTGFGSDTATRANGMIEKVTKDTVVTLEDAERDLSRRILEFQNGIQKAIGIDTWQSLSEAQQAALTSIAYNYGSLPKTIVNAIRQGGGAGAVAKAIASLSANPDRRREEAQTYLSGSGVSLSEAGIKSASTTQKSPDEIFKGDMAQIQRRIELLNAEYAAQAQVNPLVKDYGFAVDQARIKQQLLNDAKKAGVEITPELTAEIDKLAANYAKASSATEMLAEKQKKVVEASRFFEDAFGEAILGLVPKIETGNSALDRLLNTLIEAVAQAALLGNGPLAGLLGGGGSGNGIGGLLGAIFPFANGGIAKNGKPLKMFANGGISKTAAIFGETGRAEAAVPLPDGRRIPVDLRTPQLPNIRSGGREVIELNLRTDSGLIADIADQQIQTRSGDIIRISVAQANQSAPAAVGKYQRDRAGGDYRTL